MLQSIAISLISILGFYGSPETINPEAEISKISNRYRSMNSIQIEVETNLIKDNRIVQKTNKSFQVYGEYFFYEKNSRQEVIYKEGFFVLVDEAAKKIILSENKINSNRKSTVEDLMKSLLPEEGNFTYKLLPKSADGNRRIKIIDLNNKSEFSYYILEYNSNYVLKSYVCGIKLPATYGYDEVKVVYSNEKPNLKTNHYKISSYVRKTNSGYALSEKYKGYQLVVKNNK